jgi:hypothetical protein
MVGPIDDGGEKQAGDGEEGPALQGFVHRREAPRETNGLILCSLSIAIGAIGPNSENCITLITSPGKARFQNRK